MSVKIFCSVLIGLLIGVAVVKFGPEIKITVEVEHEVVSRKRRSDVYYDVDLDDDLEMHTTSYSSEETTTPTPKKLILKSNKSTPKSECVAPTAIDWTSQITPKYQMNPDKFLIPALIWGPMNQVEGLRESVAIAIHLNRTLVLPPMYRHFTDPDGPNGVVDSNVRVDIPSIRELVSTISYQALPTDFKPDSVMYARTIGFSNSNLEAQTFVTSGSRLGRIEKFENATGYSILADEPKKPTSTQDFFTVPISPRDANFNNDVRGQAGSTDWTSIFGTDGKYSVLLFPYLTAKLEATHDLGREIMSHTLRPKFIHDMVENFFNQQKLSKTIVTIHYRFDQEDWERSCRRRRDTDVHAKHLDNRAHICDLLANSSNDGLARSIAGYLVELYETKKIGDEIAFYIATPPQQQQVIRDTTTKTIEFVREQLGKSVPVSGSSTADSLQHISESYEGCDFVQENMHEVSSLFEQEVCSRGQVFVFAPSSSWSGAVRRERHINGQVSQIDHNLLDLLENYPKSNTEDDNKL